MYIFINQNYKCIGSITSVLMRKLPFFSKLRLPLKTVKTPYDNLLGLFNFKIYNKVNNSKSSY